MANLALTSPDPFACQVCGAPFGAYVRRWRGNPLRWVLHTKKAWSLDSATWSNPTKVCAHKSGLCRACEHHKNKTPLR